MFIVDTALERRQQEGNPIKIGMVGAGYMGQGMAAVIERNMVGMRVVAIANRTVQTAERAARGEAPAHAKVQRVAADLYFLLRTVCKRIGRPAIHRG